MTILIIKDFEKKYPNIPTNLISYFNNLIEKPGKNSSFHQAMSDHPDLTFEKIDRDFNKACIITNLTPDVLLQKIDFNKRDLSIERIESILGELRTILFLSETGFSDITPIRGTKDKSADFHAYYNDLHFSIEVATLIRYSTRTSNDSVIAWAKSKLIDEKKLIQLNNTALEFNADNKLFVCVINSRIINLNTHSDFIEIAKEIWEFTGKDPSLYIAIITGRVDINNISDNCIYPDLKYVINQ